MGHFTRALALARRAAQTGTSCVLLTNSALAEEVNTAALIPQGVSIVAIDPAADRDAVALRVAQEVSKQTWACALVDTFPRGLAGELPPILSGLSIPCILIHRFLCDAYADRPEVLKAAQSFDHIIVPGETAPLENLSHATRTAPWLLLDADELWGPTQARSELDIPDDGVPSVVVVGCGTAPEIQQAEKLASTMSEACGEQAQAHAHVRFVVPSKTWPLLRLLPGVDLLVGQAGYNTVQEARATGTTLIARPRTRLYDRQHGRLSDAEHCFGSDAEGISLVQTLLQSSRASQPCRYENGVHQALRVIRAAIA
ncbi:MAG: hypothetical protein JKY56_18060 [Kofleriaceae bacterium]|nr:hypothetical protein [Kofleriaceae bacterium]